MERLASKSKTLKFFGVLLLVVFVYLLPLFTVTGATDIFLKIGTIKGESVDKTHKDWIEAASFSHGVNRTISEWGPSQPSFSEISVTKRADVSSPLLFNESTFGQAQTVEMELLRGFDVRQRYYRVKLYNAFVTGMSINGTSEELSDFINFAYSKMEMTYTEFPSTTSLTPRSETTAWYDLQYGTGDVNTTLFNNTAPAISAISNTNTLEDVPVTVSFTISDAQSSASLLSVSGFSSNTGIVPHSNITFGGSGSSRTATIRGAANQSGTVTITISVSDGTASSSTSFSVTIDPVNDAPSISSISGKATEMGVPLTFSFDISDVDNVVSGLVVNGTSSNQTVVPDGNISVSGSTSSRSITVTPNAIGDTTLTLSVSDGALTNSTAFLFTVNAYTPKSPTNIVLSSSSVSENPTNGLVIGTLSAVDPDSSNHVFTLLDSAGGRFAVVGNELKVGSGALLDYEAGSAHSILVRATDGDNLTYSKELIITVINVNEAPSFTVSDASIIETISGRLTPITRLQVADPDSGIHPVKLTLEVVNGTLTVSSNFIGTVVSNGTAQVILSGAITNLNSVLSSSNGVVYIATTNLSGTDWLTATMDDAGQTGIGGPQLVYTTLGIRFYRSQYEQWLFQNFTESELNNGSLQSALWGPKADSDGDGLENVAEYGLGTSPRSAAHAKPAAEMVETPGGNILSVTLPVRQDPDLAVLVEAANDVNPSTWSVEDVTISDPTPLNNGFEEFTFADRIATTDSARRFLRIRWTLQGLQ